VRFPTYHGAYRSHMPDWVVTLAKELARGGDQADPACSALAASTCDLRTAALAASAGRPMRAPADRESIRDDLKLAFDGVGPNLAKAIAPVVEGLRNDFGRLPSLLAEPPSAPIARASAQAVLEALKAPGSVAAAWADALDSFKNDEAASARELRVRQVADLVQLRGADWSSVAGRARGCLFGDRPSLVEVGAAEGPDDPAEWAVPVDLTVDEHLAHARTAILSDPDEGQVVAWVCFAPAALRAPHAWVGTVELFSHELWPRSIIDGDVGAGVEPSPEFKDEFYEHLFMEMPEEPYVLVRLPLGPREIAGAAERARSIAKDLVRVARPQVVGG
jgi:hypothetical protein